MQLQRQEILRVVAEVVYSTKASVVKRRREAGQGRYVNRYCCHDGRYEEHFHNEVNSALEPAGGEFRGQLGSRLCP
jgi:hypothetical protein